MDKPKDAIERMRKHIDSYIDGGPILAYLDAIPDGAVPVVWPKEFTLDKLANSADYITQYDMEAAHYLRALAAIAPVKRKRMVNLWRHDEANINAYSDVSDDEAMRIRGGWRKVNREPVEIEE